MIVSTISFSSTSWLTNSVLYCDCNRQLVWQEDARYHTLERVIGLCAMKSLGQAGKLPRDKTVCEQIVSSNTITDGILLIFLSYWKTPRHYEPFDITRRQASRSGLLRVKLRFLISWTDFWHMLKTLHVMGTRVIETIKAPSQPPILSYLRSRRRLRLHNACWLPKHNLWHTRSHSNLHWCCTDRRCSPTHHCPSRRQQCSQASRRPGSWRNRLHPSAWRGILGNYSRCKCRIGQLAPWD